ncbi:MAG TPA: outer membrane beta-barrel protein [Xanthobacteraceae bacterium]|jgi:outer membrane immunogenic protein
MPFRTGRSAALALCASLASAGIAAAADIPYPVKAAPPPPALQLPAGWAGFYVGGQVGYGSDSVHWRNLGASAFFSPLDALTIDRGSGVIGGGQAGYNLQFGRVVLGIEGSLSAADFDRSFASPWFPATDVWSSKLTWLGTVTGRLGYGFDAWMPYLKAGLAAGNVDTSIANTAAGALAQGSAVHYGWTAGGGVEVKLAPRFSLGLEFMHTDLGRNTDINGAAAGAATGTVESYAVGVRSNSIMARFNYLFGGR